MLWFIDIEHKNMQDNIKLSISPKCRHFWIVHEKWETRQTFSSPLNYRWENRVWILNLSYLSSINKSLLLCLQCAMDRYGCKTETKGWRFEGIKNLQINQKKFSNAKCLWISPVCGGDWAGADNLFTVPIYNWVRDKNLNKIICVYQHASCPASVLTPDWLTATSGRVLGVENVENNNPTSTKNRSYCRVLQFWHRCYVDLLSASNLLWWWAVWRIFLTKLPV